MGSRCCQSGQAQGTFQPRGQQTGRRKHGWTGKGSGKTQKELLAYDLRRIDTDVYTFHSIGPDDDTTQNADRA